MGKQRVPIYRGTVLQGLQGGTVVKNLRVPWTARSNQSILKGISPEYSLKGLMLKLKLQYFTWFKVLTHWKRPWCWERLRAGGEGDNRGRDSSHYKLNGHESEQTLWDSEGQGSLACFSPWSHKEWQNLATEQQQQFARPWGQNGEPNSRSPTLMKVPVYPGRTAEENQ